HILFAIAFTARSLPSVTPFPYTTLFRSLGELDDDVEVAEVGPSLSADQATALVAARTAAGNGVVRLVPATALAPASRALEARGVAFQVVPGVVDGAA